MRSFHHSFSEQNVVRFVKLVTVLILVQYNVQFAITQALFMFFITSDNATGLTVNVVGACQRQDIMSHDVKPFICISYYVPCCFELLYPTLGACFFLEHSISFFYHCRVLCKVEGMWQFISSLQHIKYGELCSFLLENSVIFSFSSLQRRCQSRSY